MPKNKNAFIRYRIIDTALRNKQKRYPSKNDLIDACSGLGSVSARTMDKDIYDMKYDEELAYFAPIEYDRKYNGYYYSDPDYSINKIPLKQEDLYALEFACSLLKQFEGIEPVKQFIQSVSKIEDFISMQRIVGNDNLDEVIQTEKGLGIKGNEFLNMLLSAIKEKRVLMVHYQRFGETKIKTYTYHPYVLKEYRNRWYVTGKSPDTGRIITFALERIKEIIPVKEFFEADPSFHAKDYFKYSFGISVITDYTPEKIILRFDPKEASYIKSQPLHETQSILTDNETEFVISLEVIPSYELKSHIFSYGENVQIIQPQFLRDEHVASLQKALLLYGQSL